MRKKRTVTGKTKPGEEINFEYYRKKNKQLATKSKQACELSDSEKVQNGTHKWVKCLKGYKLVKIE